MNNKKKNYTKPALSIKGRVQSLTLAGGSFSSDAPGGVTDRPNPIGG